MGLKRPLVLFFSLVWMSACVTQAAPANQELLSTTPTAEANLTSLPTVAETSTPALAHTPIPSDTPRPITVWAAPSLPLGLLENIVLPDGVVFSPSSEADIQIQIKNDSVYSRWIYLAAAAFPSLRDTLQADELSLAWAGRDTEADLNLRLLVDAKTRLVFSQLWGEPNPNSVTVLPEDNLLDAAWDDKEAIALIPFEALSPRWKVLSVDGMTPLHKDFDPLRYPLSIPISVQSNTSALGNPGQSLSILTTNFQPEMLSSIALTGVTALVRGTALTMEARGVLYPAVDIRTWLVESDILHINNEIPFYSGCPAPELYPSEIRFCSPPKYMELLTDIGTDVIELSGDHFGDYGQDAMLETLTLYQQLGIPYYGGGANSLEARQAILLEYHGNRFAFIGCNAKGITYYAGATEDSPGAIACDFDWLVPEITRLKEAGYIVIATFQHNEYYTYEAQPDLIRDFQRLAEAGAVIVSGSQAHQPHGMAFFNGSFLHYGLGNLFFDQYRFFPGPELDRAFIDRHYFYAGKYINTELLTIKFVDLARSRPTTPEERDFFLKQIFTASGW